MERIKTTVKKWGNSFGIILPKKLINSGDIQEGNEIIVNIESEKNMSVKNLIDFANKHPLRFKEKTNEALKKVNEELWFEGD